MVDVEKKNKGMDMGFHSFIHSYNYGVSECLNPYGFSDYNSKEK